VSSLKRVAKRVLAHLGYELRRRAASGEQLGPSQAPPVRFDNFLSLATAYEQKLSEASGLIPQNARRAQLLARLQGTPPSEAYFIIQALAGCRELAGDVCEFGVAQGETSALMANEIAHSDKRLHLFDSFAGLPKPSEKDRLTDDIFCLGSVEAYAGTMACPEDMVRSRLDALAFGRDRYVIHRGFIEESLLRDSTLPREVCFAYVDFDFYEPTRVALEFLHGVTGGGSVIIVDDYDFFSTGVKTAVDEFVQEKAADGVPYECAVPDPRYGRFVILTRMG
jgi:O-methyltransferase